MDRSESQTEQPKYLELAQGFGNTYVELVQTLSILPEGTKSLKDTRLRAILDAFPDSSRTTVHEGVKNVLERLTDNEQVAKRLLEEEGLEFSGETLHHLLCEAYSQIEKINSFQFGELYTVVKEHSIAEKVHTGFYRLIVDDVATKILQERGINRKTNGHFQALETNKGKLAFTTFYLQESPQTSIDITAAHEFHHLMYDGVFQTDVRNTESSEERRMQFNTVRDEIIAFTLDFDALENNDVMSLTMDNLLPNYNVSDFELRKSIYALLNTYEYAVKKAEHRGVRIRAFIYPLFRSTSFVDMVHRIEKLSKEIEKTPLQSEQAVHKGSIFNKISRISKNVWNSARN